MPVKLLCLFCLVSLTLFGQTRNYDIKKLGIEQGISSNYVVSITQDRKGFLWFATESGLNRFDGSKFRVYKKNQGTSAISGNELNKVYADQYEDVVWIATQREGLNRFDCNTGKLTHYKHDDARPAGIITNDITDISNSGNGNLWISTYYRGVEYFDKKNETFIHYNRATVPGMVSDNVWSVAEDSKGNLYIGHVNAGLSILSLKDRKIRNFRHRAGDEASLPGDEVKTVYVDRSDNVWIGTNNGLALFNSEKGSFVVFKHDPANSLSLAANFVYTIRQLHDGKLWIGTEKGGISILDVKHNMFLDPRHILLEHISYSGDDSGLSNPTIRSIFQDSFNNIWLGTYGGGVNFIGHRPPLFRTWTYSPIQTRKEVLNNPVAWGISSDTRGRIWVGTDGGGINIFQNGRRTGTISRQKDKLADDAVLAAMRDSSGNLWFGTFKGGVNVLNPQGQRIIHFGAGGNDSDIRCFYEDSGHIVWVGSSSGLYQYNTLTKQLKLYSSGNSKIPGNLVRAVSKDNKGQLWVGFFGQGLAVLDKDLRVVKTYDTYSGFPSNTVNYIYRDRKGGMWVATGEGLVWFRNGGSYQAFTEKDGLSNSHIRAITEDANGNIWFSTIGGISRFMPSQKRFFNYDYHHGVPLGDFMSGSVTKDPGGKIYFGSQNGVCYFDPLLIPTHIKLPETIITGFKVYQNQLKADNVSDLPVNSGIHLNYRQNTFSVSFNVLDFSLNQLTEYAYMLRGLSDSWNQVQGDNSVTFRNIPPGTYELLIRSRIKNQDWKDNITSLRIVISPPFWLTWWAKTIYMLAAGVVGWFILRFYKRKLNLENSLVLEKMNHRHEQELHDERIRFFTNITHELRTPLTLILGPLEDLKGETGLSENHSSRISVIHKSAARLLTLINQLLEFQKTESQNRKLTVLRGNIEQLVLETGLKYKELNTNKNVDFSIVSETRNTTWYFDPDIVATILDNLLSNAFKYTQTGSIVLALRDVTDHGVQFTEIEVSDTGSGIPADAISKIFERYYQVGRDRHVSGTGIGLALAQNLASIHEGKIFVESTLGEGSSFRFRIGTNNGYPDAIHQDAVLPEDVLIHEEGKQSGGKQVVLVVEDNHDIRDYIFQSLSEQYLVYTAANGKEGIEKAFTHIPDIIVSDIMMPEADGFELGKTLKEDIRTSHIPIIFLTVRDAVLDRKESYNIGVDSYLTKPFSAELLKSRIGNLLDARKKLAELISKNTDSKHAGIAGSLNKIDNEFIEKITSVIEENIDSDKIDVVFIADKMMMSHSTLYRKVKALAGISVNEFIRKVRIRHAEKLLLTGRYTISEISYMVGINSITYFRQCFKDEFGLAPSEYVKKLNSSDSSLS
ncbi:hybrid sensor histidine kinase/response regulator transcription factor [Pararcticibacter amylolyticus]|uniref:histidine kinase n=1 Tax=Pararcticibacter amylolyticus TaxID=2173175 RepID=A0A2U2PB97_9SPHI|nr:two-component regulator propeller domain-containing protein [Pararcticibacter amylolyticus]PWG78389.1 hybrid sensor histidine kinase/response regulator [Pararcticibacter amylolyticus]